MILPLIVQFTIAFSGGSDADLANSIESALKLPCVLFANHTTQWKPFSAKHENQQGLLKGIKSSTKLLGFSNEGNGLYPPAYPSGFFVKNNRFTYLESYGLPSRYEVKDGQFSFEAEADKPLSLEFLTEKLKLNITWHPFFNEARFYVSAKKVSEKKLVSLVATSLGASLNDTKGVLYFDINPSEMRKRVLRMADGIQLDTRDETLLRTLFGSHGFSLLSDEQIRSVYSDMYGDIAIPLPPTTLASILALRRIDVFLTDPTGNPAIIDRCKNDWDPNVAPEYWFAPSSGSATRVKHKPGLDIVYTVF